MCSSSSHRRSRQITVRGLTFTLDRQLALIRDDLQELVDDVSRLLAAPATLEGVEVCWTFARELLLDGQYEPTGDGDVHVWPCLSPRGDAVVIRGPDGAEVGRGGCAMFPDPPQQFERS